MDALPSVLFVGPMKAGTTWIYVYLKARGDVCVPRAVKETFFFDRSFGRGAAWYARHFDLDPARHRIVAEVAPSLFPDAEAPARVRETLGARPTIVFTLRDPVRRAWSHYLHLRRYGYTREDLRAAAETFPQLLEASRYEAAIGRWKACLPEARFLTLHLDELKASPERYVEALCEGLAIPYDAPTAHDLEPANVAGEAPSFHLARLGRRTAYALRDSGLYSMVNAAKALGLRSVFFGGRHSQDAVPKPKPEDLDWIRTRLDPARAPVAAPSPAPAAGPPRRQAAR